MAVEQKHPSITQTGGRDATTGVIPGRYALSVGRPDSTPPPGWRWTPLSSVARLESGHTPSRKVPAYWDGDIPWVGIRDATENHGRTISTTHQTVTQAGIDNSSARVLPAGTVCLSRTASVGYVVVMGRPMATSQDFVNWVCSDAIDNNFLKYILLSENDSMLRFASGTTHQTIYYPEAKAFHVCLPEIAEQRAIVSILSALDDKIELNRRMNETLEEMARALFKSWFVDFDPVRARAEGRTPEGIDAETAALFPDSFENSDLGMIPIGWEIGRLDDLLVLQRGFDLPAPDRIPGSYPILSASGPAGTHIEYKVKGPGVTTGRSGLLGKVFFVHENFWPLNTSLWVKEFRRARPIYAYHLLSDLDFDTFNAGSAVPTLNRNHVHNLRVLIPPLEVIERFEAISAPIFQRCYQINQESLTLTSIRDALLPKLMSGEIRVKP